MSQTFVPESVCIEFLRHLSETVHPQDPVVLVLRGSFLLRHWFGECARPAGDLDLECFEKVRGTWYGGARQRFSSPVDCARGLCCFAAEGSQQFPRPAHGIEFDEIESPEDGDSLWTYGSPGERYYLGWMNRGRGDQSGRMQLDIAQAGTYNLNDISVADVHLVSANGGTFRFPAYAPEMMLAAKLSWLMRGLTRCVNVRDTNWLKWTGETKDLFDAHLLLTKGTLRAEVFQKSLLAVGADDEINWNNIQAVFDVRQATMTDGDFANWEEFAQRHQGLTACGPVQMLRTVADRLEPLLGDFYPREEMPFLLAINSDPVDEVSYLVYADWLEEHGNVRDNFLRLFTKWYFREAELPHQERAHTLTALKASFRDMSIPWLLQLFGTSARYRDIRQRIENGT